MDIKKKAKDIVDIRISADSETYQAIIMYQAKRISEDGIHYPRSEAASDLFALLVKSQKNKPK